MGELLFFLPYFCFKSRNSARRNGEDDDFRPCECCSRRGSFHPPTAYQQRSRISDRNHSIDYSGLNESLACDLHNELEMILQGKNNQDVSDWRKILFIGVVMTISGAVLQFLVLPARLNTSVEVQVEISSYKPLNSTVQLSETHPLATVERFPLIPTTPIVLLTSSGLLPVPVVVPVEERKGKVRRRTVPRRKRKNVKIDEIIHIPPPPPRITPTPFQRRIWSLSPDKALDYAKRELEHVALPVIDDPELYSPLFRNVSLFKRSYELMELALKVYIYPDGKRPIFHEPHLRGIYASEGWFMKLIEENRQFVTKDPEKAHLFYLPYSARQLEMALYVSDSYNLKPLSIFLRDYVNMLSANYPYWNRTRGFEYVVRVNKTV